MINLILNLVTPALALLVVDIIFPGVTIHSFLTAVIAGIAIGAINLLVRPILFILSLPITILTLGAFMLVVNGVCFWLASVLVPGFVVHGMWALIFAPIVMGLSAAALNQYFEEKSIQLPFKFEKGQFPGINRPSLPTE